MRRPCMPISLPHDKFPCPRPFRKESKVVSRGEVGRAKRGGYRADLTRGRPSPFDKLRIAQDLGLRCPYTGCRSEIWSQTMTMRPSAPRYVMVTSSVSAEVAVISTSIAWMGDSGSSSKSIEYAA